MSKQPNKTAQVKKNIEVALGRNPISRLFDRKKPKRRVGRTKTTKRQRGSLKKRGNFTSEATLKSKSSKTNKTGKYNISPVNGAKKNEDEKKKQMKWVAGYLHKLHTAT